MLALASGMDEDDWAVRDFEADRVQRVLERYEATYPDTHLLRVQSAYLEIPISAAARHSPH